MLQLSFKGINKLLLLLTIVSLAFNLEKGSFSYSFTPNLFQALLVISIIFTVIYVLKNNKLKEFFLSIPKKILWTISSLFLSIFLGWIIAILFFEIPTTLHAVLDFGTFFMGIVLFFLVYFYTKDDEKYFKWCLYTLFIPNFYLIYYFLTHGIVGYWGVLNDYSLDNILDPNILSKILLIPALFFISMSLYTLKNKNWKILPIYIVSGSIFSMLIFWTISRGAALSLFIGSIVILLIFSFREFNWRKFLLGILIVSFILSLGYMIVPEGVTKEFETKVVNTGNIPTSRKNYSISKIIDKTSNITLDESNHTPRLEVRVFEWSFYLRYALQHPFGIGPNSSADFKKLSNNSYIIPVGPDNTYLEIWVWGGLLGIISFLYLLWNIFVFLWRKWSNYFDPISLSLLGIFSSFLIVINFDASLGLYCFFIILSLSLVPIDKFKKNE